MPQRSVTLTGKTNVEKLKFYLLGPLVILFFIWPIIYMIVHVMQFHPMALIPFGLLAAMITFAINGATNK